MRAIIFEEFGEPAEVLQLREVPAPEPSRGEVLVRMLASPINPSDLMTIRGVYQHRPELPATPGYEGVGIIESSGGGLLGKFLIGKRVAVLNRATGNWSEQTVIPAKQAIPLPNDLPLEQAAMFFINPATAYVMTRHVLRIPAGAWLLQTAAGSAVGRMIIRLGRTFGFRTLNVVRRSEQVEELKALGADAVLTFDPAKHPTEQFLEEVMLITENRGIRYAVDPVGGETGSAIVRCLGEHGRLLVYGTLTSDPLSFPPRTLIMTGAHVEGFLLSTWMDAQSLLGKMQLVRTLTRLMRKQILVSDVGQTFPLEQITEAVQHAEQVARGGKTLLRIGSE